MATNRHCKACGLPFSPWPQTKNQQYCSEPACQRERRRRKQAERRSASPQIRLTNAEYFKDWCAKHPDYWKKYRSLHPDYVERNRLQQRERNRQRIAKDTLNSRDALPSGLYRLSHATTEPIANEAAWLVEITVLSSARSAISENCKTKP